VEQQYSKKFYQAKTFRALIAVVLAVVLLTNGAVERMSTLFAAEQEEIHEEVHLVAPGPEQGFGDRDQGMEDQDEPEAEPEEDTGAAKREASLAKTIEADGVVYVYVSGHLYDDQRMRSRHAVGEVQGIAVATAYNEADADHPRASVWVAFATQETLIQGYMSVNAVTLLYYDDVIEEIGEDGVREYQSATWPLPAARFTPAKTVADVPENELEEEIEEIQEIQEESEEEQPVIVAFIDAGKAGEPLDTFELGNGEAIADVSLPQSLSVLLSDDTVLDLPVEWQTEEGEPVADAGDETLDKGEEMRVEPTWDMGFLPMSEGLDLPFILLSGGGEIGFAPASDEIVPGEVRIVFADEPPPFAANAGGSANAAYDVLIDTSNKFFTVFYGAPTTGTQEIILLVKLPQYGAQFTEAPQPNDHTVALAAIVPGTNNTTMAIQLHDGIGFGSSTAVTSAVGMRMQSRALTRAEVEKWMDDGALPTSIEVEVVRGKLNANGTYTKTADLSNYVYGTFMPANYAATTAQLFSVAGQYNLHVSSMPKLTNQSFWVTTSTNQPLFFSGSTPYYAFRWPSVHNVASITGNPTLRSPLIEITGIKLYVPDERLQLRAAAPLATTNTTSYAFTATTGYYWTNWTVGTKQFDTALGKSYYVIKPPTTANSRVFNALQALTFNSFAGSLRPNWELIDLNDGLDYVDASIPGNTPAYTLHYPGDAAITQLMYQLPGGLGNPPMQGTVNLQSPRVSTYPRNTWDDMRIVPYIWRNLSNTTSQTFTYGTTANTPDVVGMVNASDIVVPTGSTLRHDMIPSYRGEVKEVYGEFPHALQPTGITILSGYATGNSAIIEKQTQIKSIEYKLLNDAPGDPLRAISQADINNINITLQQGLGGSRAVSFPEVTAANRIVRVEVTWDRVVTDNWFADNTSGRITTSNTGTPWGTGGRHEEITRFTFTVPTADEFGVAYTTAQTVRVPYTNSRKDFGNTTANNWAEANYLHFRLVMPTQQTVTVQCPTLMGQPAYTLSSSTMGPASHWADGVSEYNAGQVYMSVPATTTNSTTNSSVIPLLNPVIQILGSSKHGMTGTAVATATEITNMDEAVALGFLNGRFNTSQIFGGWVITYSTNQRTNHTFNIPTGQTAMIPVNLGIDWQNGEYLTSLRFSFDGEFTFPVSTGVQTIRLMENAGMIAWNKHFVNGNPLQLGASNTNTSFFVRLTGRASWDNCADATNCGHRHNPATTPPGQLMTPNTSWSHFPGVRYYFTRQATLQPTAPAATYTGTPQLIWQGEATNPVTFASYNYTVNITGQTPQSQSFWRATLPTVTTIPMDYPWGINEYIYIEFREPAFIFNPATTTIFGIPATNSEIIEYEMIKSNDDRDFLKITFKAGNTRNNASAWTAPGRAGYVQGNTISSAGTLSQSNVFGGTAANGIRIGLRNLPGSELRDYYPLGEMYFDYSELLQYYTVPVPPNPTNPIPAQSALNTYSRDTRTRWNLGATGLVADALGLSSTPITGNKLYRYTPFTNYMVSVQQATSLSVNLTPGKNRVYDFLNRTIEFNDLERHQVDAFLGLLAATDKVAHDYTAYIKIPKAGTPVAYTGGVETSNISFNLTAPPEILNDTTGIPGNITFAYTTANNPNESSAYTTVAPTTPAGWAAVTGIRIRVGLMPMSRAVSFHIPMEAQVKGEFGVKKAYIGGTYNFSETEGGAPAFTTPLSLGTYNYNDLLVTSGGGFVFFDVLDEDGLWSGSTATERYPIANEVTVRLLDTNGTTQIDQTTVDPATGRFQLSTFKGDAGQIIEIGLPTSTGNWRLTAQSEQDFWVASNDSDFNRTTRRLTLGAIPLTGFSNISAGFVRLPEITMQDVSAQPGQTTSSNAAVNVFMTGNRDTYPGYEYVLSAPANTAIAEITNSGVPTALPGTTGNATIPVSVKGLQPGATTATITVYNRLGDAVTVTYEINVASAKIDVDVVKVWADNTNALGMRPDSIQLQLQRKIEGGTASAMGNPVTVTGPTNTAANWTHKFEDVDEQNSEGKPYIYEIREVNVDPNYTDTYSADGKTVTNTIRTRALTATKKWELLGTGIGSETIRVNLFRSDTGSTVFRFQDRTGTPTNGAEWEFEFTGLPVNVKGTNTPIVYTVDEQTVPTGMDKTLDQSTLTITNTYRKDDEKNVEVKWVHTGAPPATRTAVEATGVTITLTRNAVSYKTQLLRTGDGKDWKHTFAVPYRDMLEGQTFAITGSAVTGYAVAYSVDNGTLVATYTYTMPKVTVSGAKVWVDTPTGLAKPNITINLFRNGGTEAFRTTTVTTPVANSSANFSFTDLDQYDPDGIAYVYTTKESPVAGYTTTQEGHTITNTYSPGKAEVDAILSKTLTGTGAPDETFTFRMVGSTGAAMPSGSTGQTKEVQAKAGSVEFGRIEFTVPGTFTYTFTEMAPTPPTEGMTYDTGIAVMTVKVDDEEGVLKTNVSYTKNGSNATGINFANSYTIPQRRLVVTLNWADNNNALNGRPAAAAIQLYSTVEGGAKEAVGAAVNMTGTGAAWTHEFTNLPVHATDGKIYTYSVEQVAVPNYVIAYNPNNTDVSKWAQGQSGNLTLSIRDTLETIQIGIEKVWDVKGTGFSKPANIGINVYRATGSGSPQFLKAVTVPAVSGDIWSYTVDQLLEYDLTGAKYVYTFTEPTPPTGIDVDVKETTITNTYRADTQIKTQVVWVHTGAPQATRTSVESAGATLTLRRNGTTYGTGQLLRTGDGKDWKHTFEVPWLDSMNNETFTIVGSAVTGYTVAYSEAEGALVATYTFTMPKITVNGTKVWVDTPTGLAKPNVVIHLHRNGVTPSLTSQTLTTPTASNSVPYSFAELDRYDSEGVEYVYTTKESAVAGYTTTQEGYTITNTYSPGKAEVDAVASKTLTGGGAPDETFTFQMVGSTGAPMPTGSTGQTKQETGKAGFAVEFGRIDFTVPGTFTYTFTEIAPTPPTEGMTYDNGTAVMTVQVDDEDGVLKTQVTYTKNGAAATGTNFANTYASPQRKVTVSLNWADNNDALNGRPSAATIQLFRTPEGGAKEAVGSPVQITGAGATWTRDFDNMLAHDSTGKVYTYSVEQVAVPNYAIAYNPDGNDVPAWERGQANDLTLSIRDTVETIQVSGQKVWNIVGTGFTKPSSIEVNLFRNDGSAAYRVIEVIPGSNPDVWGFTISNLLEYMPNGTAYTYTITEKTEIFAVVSEVDGMTITNTYGADATVRTRVEWDHTGAPEADKPTSVSMSLIRNNGATPYATQTVDAAKGWVHTFPVPQADFQEATFSIELAPITRYETTYSTVDGVLVAKNTYVMPLKDVDVTVDWVDNSDELSIRPISTFIRLYRAVPGGSPEPVPNCALSISATGTGNRWTHTFTDLPTYDAQGRLYTYTVGQENLHDYYAGEVDGLPITNTLKAGGIHVSKTSTPKPSKPGEAAVVMIGDVITYTITVRNTSERPVSGVIIKDTIPKEFTVGTPNPAPKSNTLNPDGSRTLIWELGMINKDATATITLPITVAEEFETFTNTAYYNLPDEPEEPIIDPVEIQRVSLTKSASPAEGAQLVEGQVVTYTLKLDVRLAASGIVVRDVLPEGMTFVPGSITTTGQTNGTYNAATRTVAWPDQLIPAGGVTMTFQATVDKFTGVFSKPIRNVATATIIREDGNNAELSADVEHEAVRRQVTLAGKDMALVDEHGAAGSYQRGTATAPIEAELGQTLRYNLSLASTGYLPQGTVIVEDTLHPDVGFVADSTSVIPASAASKVTLTQTPSASNGNKAIWTVTGLAKDEALEIIFEATAPLGTDDPATPEYETRKAFTNTASLTDNGLKNLVGGNGAPVYTNAQEYTSSSNTVFGVVYESDLVARKSSVPESPKANGDVVVVQAGDIITYTITVTNVGDKDAINGRVMDTLPAGVEFVAATGASPAPLVLTESGVTTLMWQLPKLAAADRITGQPVPAGIMDLTFTVRVLTPASALLLENFAYSRLSAEGEAFPTVAGKPDSMDSYRKTGDKVEHQTFTFRIETGPAGGLTPATAALIAPGSQITYAGILEAAATIRDVRMQDVVPQGLIPAPGSIRIIGPGNTITVVPDSAYNPATRTITWPEINVTAGETRFEVILIVEKLPDGVLEMDYEIGADASLGLADGNGARKSAGSEPVYYAASIGFSEISKTAALIENGVIQAADPGTEQDPVRGVRGQQVEYILTVTREAGARNRSGRIVITDVLPAGMTLVPDSIQGTVMGQGEVASMNASGTGVEWALDKLGDGDVATLCFRAQFPETVNDAQTPDFDTRRDFVNTARLVDEAIRDMRYARAIPGHGAETNVYTQGQYDKRSNATYHYILGAKLDVVLSCNVPNGNRVYGGNTLTYTIRVTNSGAVATDNVLVRDRIHSFLTFVPGSQTSSRSDTEFAQEGATIGWVIPHLEVGETVVFTFRARVGSMQEIGSRLIPNTAEFAESRFGVDPRTEVLRGRDYFSNSNTITHFQRVGAKVIIRKVDAQTGAPLAGAEFILRQVSTSAAHDQIGDRVAVTNRDGEAVFEDVPLGRYITIETVAPEGYIGSDIRRSLDINGSRVERTIVVPNRRAVLGVYAEDDRGERMHNWRILMEMIEDMGVPNAGAVSRNVGDTPQ